MTNNQRLDPLPIYHTQHQTMSDMSDNNQIITLESDIKINSFINNKGPGNGHHKFVVKIRDLLEGMSHEVQDFILRECDNESTSDAFKREVRKTISQILDSYVSKLVD